MYRIKQYFFFTVLIFVVFSACNKEDDFISESSARLIFSEDTITFDTIFTEIGSVTKLFKIYNQNKGKIRLTSVYLSGGEESDYRISVDGRLGEKFENIDIPANDSLFVFVEVTLDPVAGNHPLVVEDAVVINSNGNTDNIVLESFGQNVHFINGEYLETQTWTNDKPYLIYNGVAVSAENTLTIEKGVKVYFHYTSGLAVYGNIQVKGTAEEPVLFRGDRFDVGYDSSAGRWRTIYIDPGSRDNLLEYALIKNAQAGIQVGYPGDNDVLPQLEIRNSMILNSSFAGIIAYGAEISAYNTVIGDAGQYGLLLLNGGKYNFYHNTISLLGAYSVKANAFRIYQHGSDFYGILMTNYYMTSYPNVLDSNYIPIKKNYYNDLIEANFYNSIVYIDGGHGVFSDFDKSADSNYYFDHCLIQKPKDTLVIKNENLFSNVIFDEDPGFINNSLLEDYYNFKLDTASFALDAGSMDIINSLSELEYDIEGNNRTLDDNPDLGAYERIE